MVRTTIPESPGAHEIRGWASFSQGGELEVVATPAPWLFPLPADDHVGMAPEELVFKGRELLRYWYPPQQDLILEEVDPADLAVGRAIRTPPQPPRRSPP